jgi:hypothetical protein
MGNHLVTLLGEEVSSTPLLQPLGDGVHSLRSDPNGSDCSVSHPAEQCQTAPPVADEVTRYDETSQQDDRWSPGQERQIGTEHQSENRKELEHWINTVGRWGRLRPA